MGSDVAGLALQLLEVGLLFSAVLALAYYATRYLGRRLPGLAVRHMRLIEQLPLGGRRSVCLVRVADRVLVLGATDEHVTLLQTLDDPELVERVADAGAAQGRPWIPGGRFAARLVALGAAPMPAADDGSLQLAEEDLPVALRGSLERLRELRGRQADR